MSPCLLQRWMSERGCIDKEPKATHRQVRRMRMSRPRICRPSLRVVRKGGKSKWRLEWKVLAQRRDGEVSAACIALLVPVCLCPLTTTSSLPFIHNESRPRQGTAPKCGKSVYILRFIGAENYNLLFYSECNSYWTRSSRQKSCSRKWKTTKTFFQIQVRGMIRIHNAFTFELRFMQTRKMSTNPTFRAPRRSQTVRIHSLGKSKWNLKQRKLDEYAFNSSNTRISRAAHHIRPYNH